MPLEGKVPFNYLHDADNERIYLLIKDENPGVQSMVLSHLEPKKAAKIINLMTPEEKKEVVMRLAKMEPVSPDILRRVDQAMHEKSLSQTVEKAENIDGRNALAQILKKMDVGAENDILTYLSEDDPDLGQDLRSRLFTMDDVVKSDDRFVQEKLREMSETDIAYLIAAKPDDFREKILSNISAGRRAEVRAQEDILKPMRRSDCERITSEFFSKLRRAFEEGHLIIQDRNDDVFV
jgi:flagellar motor switch protein FliG